MRRKCLLVMSVLVLALGACWSCSHFQTTSIGSILDNPREYDGKVVRVKGTVVEGFGALLINIYEISDESGTIPVISTGAMPRKGADVEVVGRVNAAFSLGDQSLVVLRENSEK